MLNARFSEQYGQLFSEILTGGNILSILNKVNTKEQINYVVNLET